MNKVTAKIAKQLATVIFRESRFEIDLRRDSVKIFMFLSVVNFGDKLKG